MSDSSEIKPLNNILINSQGKQLTPEELFFQGKKHYIVGEYSKCLEFLSQACKLKELEVGHLSDEIFEMYFYLAKGYYMYSKYESELFGEAVEKADEENDGGSEEKFNAEDEDNLESNEIDNEKVETPDGSVVNKSKEQIVTDETSKNSQVSERETVTEDQQGTSSMTTAKSNREVLTYLQLSYENVEAAKLILKRQINEKKIDKCLLDMKMADCCDLVGNIYVEEGVINEAIDEYKKGLELRMEHTSKCDRAVAESHYNLGMAFSIDMQLSEAIDQFSKCKSIMVDCKTEEIEKGGDGQEFSEIILDIDEKIIDCQEGERDYKRAKESIQQFLVSATPVSISADTPVNDVTHLVKRKVDDSTKLKEASEPLAKCRKLNDESNEPRID